MIKTLIRENILKDKAAIVILDPKGDLSRDVAKFIDHTLPHRKEKLVYLSPFDFTGYTPVINPFQLPPHDPKEYEIMVRLTSQELERTLDNIFSEMYSGFTGQMKSVLGPCIETLIRKGDCDMWDLMRFMDDNRNGDLVALGKNSPNPAISLFFTHNFPGIISETRKGIEWRCRNLLKSQVFSGLTSGKSTVHLKQLINQRKCIIFNLDKGKMGTDVSAHFGKLVVSLIQVMAMQRGGLPVDRKTPIYLYIDEFHNYVTESIKEVLAESRSNKLFLTLAQQLVGQGITERDFKRVLMGNTNVKIIAQSTQENYNELSSEFGLDVTTMLNLPKYYYFVKVGNGKAFRVKGRGGLVEGKNEMSQESWDEIVSQQIKNYYVPAKQAENQRKLEELYQPVSNISTGKQNGFTGKPAKKKRRDEPGAPDESTLYPF